LAGRKKKMTNIYVKLSSAGMGEDVTQEAFDSWVDFVARKLNQEYFADVYVEQFELGADEDDVVECDDLELEVTSDISGCYWDEWCGE
jgi:hypothetical protein